MLCLYRFFIHIKHSSDSIALFHAAPVSFFLTWKGALQKMALVPPHHVGETEAERLRREACGQPQAGAGPGAPLTPLIPSGQLLNGFSSKVE